MGDAFGRMLYDFHRDRLADEPVHRRDDGVSWSAADLLEWYFAIPEEWPDAEFEALEYLTGPVLDLGCGTGRHALYLQERCEVVAIDRSPLAVRTARERGVERPVVGDMMQLPTRAEFGSVLAAGGQLGVPGSIDGLRGLLDEFANVVVPGGRLVADVLDPTTVEDPTRRGYLEANRRREGVSVRRFRVEYDGTVGPWIDLLQLSPDALRDVVAGTEWHVTGVLDREGTYTAVLSRVEHGRDGMARRGTP